MKKWIERIGGFFKDNKQEFSMTRLLSFVSVVSGCAMAFIYPEYEVGYLGIITLGFGGKITQKKLSEK